MKLTIDDLRAVVNVADRSSFNRAAEALGITQPALTRRINKAESYLNAALFERTTHRVKLLPIGEFFVARSKAILNDFDRLDAEMRSLASGANAVIEFSCLRTVANALMPRLIQQFRKSSEGVTFQLREDNGIRAIERVAEHEVDFGVSIWLPDGPELDFELLVEDPFVLCCAPTHELWDTDPITWRSAFEQKISFFGGTAANRRLLSSVLDQSGVRMTWDEDIQSLSTQMGFVDEGIVAAVLPRLGMTNSRNPNLCARLLIEPTVQRKIGIFTRPSWRPSAASMQFLDLLRASFAVEYNRTTQLHPAHKI